MIGRSLLALLFGRETPCAQGARKRSDLRSAAILAIFALFVSSCQPPPLKQGTSTAIELNAVDIADVVQATPAGFGAARGEWIGFAIRVASLPRGKSLELRLSELRAGDAALIGAENYSLYRIAPIALDTNFATYARFSGTTRGVASFPRALVLVDSRDGSMNLNGETMAWVDIHVPLAATPGNYSGTVDVVDARTKRVAASMPVSLRVYGFALSERPRVHLVGKASWEALTRLYGERFANLEPKLLSREDKAAAPAIAVIDSLMRLGRENRVTMTVPEIAPVIKWPPGREPLVEWDDYDALAAPWAESNGFIAVPNPPELQKLQPIEHNAIQTAFAKHFAQKQWEWNSDPGLVNFEPIGETGARLQLWRRNDPTPRVEDYREVSPTMDGPRDVGRVTDVAWFYPGGWYGTFGVVPSIQLKWARQAEQDAEYFEIAKERGIPAARQIAEILRGAPHPTPADIRRARGMVAEMIERNETNATIAFDDEQSLWLEPLARARVAAVRAQWGMKDGKLQLSVMSSLMRTADWPEGGELSWGPAPAGWTIEQNAVTVPAFKDHVAFGTLSASFNPASARGVIREPAEIQFVDAHLQRHSSTHLVAPVAVSVKRIAGVNLDANLTEWDASDAIWEGPLTKFWDATMLGGDAIKPAAADSAIYTAWGAENFYVAFKVAGSATRRASRNFVQYQDDRAWGEDLCQILIHAPGGEALHIVCKEGSTVVERKVKGQWTPAGSALAPYASNIANGEWTGELAIPWKELLPPGGEIPAFVEFNFSQHRDSTGESASWAGPVYSGRDDNFMGAIVLKDPSQ